jgi:hypothetical protein
MTTGSFLTSLDNDWVKDPNDLRIAKALVGFIASGIVGRERGSKPTQSSVVQSWKNLTASWKWAGCGCIEPEVKTSMRNVKSQSLCFREWLCETEFFYSTSWASCSKKCSSL